MFDFEKLDVYQISLKLNIEVLKWLAGKQGFDPYFKDQLRRATISVGLNLAEGTGRYSAADKKRFFVIARSSVYECVSILQILKGTNEISLEHYNHFYQEYEKLSKMLLGLYRSTK